MMSTMRIGMKHRYMMLYRRTVMWHRSYDMMSYSMMLCWMMMIVVYLMNVLVDSSVVACCCCSMAKVMCRTCYFDEMMIVCTMWLSMFFPQ